MGHRVEATHALKHKLADMYKFTTEQHFYNYQEMLGWINNADIIVCELSFPSTVTSGHIFTRALVSGKPVLVLYKEDSCPPLLLGLELERFRMASYNNLNLEKVLEREISELLKLPDTRFTLLLPSDIITYLDNIAEKGTSRSEYIRNIIKNDMKKRRK